MCNMTVFVLFQEVTVVEFHPSALVLASGSKDCTVKLFDISKPSVKKAYRSLQVSFKATFRTFHKPLNNQFLEQTQNIFHGSKEFAGGGGRDFLIERPH